jgi:fluoride ion exporter CrcB/FEX
VNDRVFKSVEGKIQHAVTISVVDAFSLFPLLYPSYDTNSGLKLGVETKYDNSLGTMTNWYLDMYLVLSTTRKTSWSRGPLPGGSDYNQDKFAFTLSNTVGYGKVNWVGSFLDGFDANIEGSLNALDRDDVFGATGSIGATSTWYLPWKILDYYVRLHAEYVINDDSIGLGSWLRGVKGQHQNGVAGVFTNQTLAIDVISNFLICCTVGMELTSDSLLDHIEMILNTGLTY